MLISSLMALTMFWYAVQSFPGLFEATGFVFGILVAFFTLDAGLLDDPE